MFIEVDIDNDVNYSEDGGNYNYIHYHSFHQIIIM